MRKTRRKPLAALVVCGAILFFPGAAQASLPVPPVPPTLPPVVTANLCFFFHQLALGYSTRPTVVPTRGYATCENRGGVATGSIVIKHSGKTVATVSLRIWETQTSDQLAPNIEMQMLEVTHWTPARNAWFWKIWAALPPSF